ncbi:hypothetical protein CAPNMURICA_41 [Arthrobacter phage CapnMurica]|uniref:Uncharacterized protein n=1 Tax=Arthrobacter phage CapnMurica TaxID=1772294 RepID=A0A0U4JK08_9CAUD|nr:hypothetical protein FDH68_gp41 [Arthrobacter phage CaptnMurica]ALY08641.1 hypothetical protein CAPNMURICA_41 [Arthrobacter phage CaptnMurica]
MSEINTVTNTCEDCGLTSTDHRIFKLDSTITNSATFIKVVCYSEGACEYRQKNHPELMANLKLITCERCEFRSNIEEEFTMGPDAVSLECVDLASCKRRQKRTAILAEMKEMAKKPHLHPVDKFSRAAVLTCGIFMGAVSAFGLSYLWFGV